MNLRKITLGAALTIFTATALVSCSKKDDTCPSGYEGTDCKTLMSTKFIGTYAGSETCTVGNDNYEVSLNALSDNNMKMTLKNLYNDNYSLTVTITESNKFSISGTDKGVTFTGDGVLSGSTLSITYTANDGATSNSCTFKGEKK